MVPPIRPESRFITLGDNLRLHYSSQGDGPAVILLQGSGPGASGWLNYRYNVQHLVESGFRVIIPDLPGFGDSDKPERDYSLDFFADTVREFADCLELQHFALVGNSLGGAIGLAVALAAPERIGHLVLMGCGGLEDQATYFQTMAGIQAMTRVPLGSPEFTPAYLKQVLQLIVFDPRHITDELIEERFRVLRTQNPSVFTRMVVPNLTEHLREVRCPVLAFWGAEDRFCPVSGAEKLARQVPDAQVITLSQCGHWVMIEYPELFNRRCVEFLRGGSAKD